MLNELMFEECPSREIDCAKKGLQKITDKPRHNKTTRLNCFAIFIFRLTGTAYFFSFFSFFSSFFPSFLASILSCCAVYAPYNAISPPNKRIRGTVPLRTVTKSVPQPIIPTRPKTKATRPRTNATIFHLLFKFLLRTKVIKTACILTKTFRSVKHFKE